MFDALEALALCLTATTGMVTDMTVNAEALRKAAGTGYATATDLADWLVREAGLPFREAHHVTGAVVSLAEKKGARLDELELADMRRVDARITQDVFSVLGIDESVKSRTSLGGTAPARVRQQARHWQRALARAAERAEADRS